MVHLPTNGNTLIGVGALGGVIPVNDLQAWGDVGDLDWKGKRWLCSPKRHQEAVGKGMAWQKPAVVQKTFHERYAEERV